MSAIGDYIHLTSQGYFYGIVPATLNEDVFSVEGAREQRSNKAAARLEIHRETMRKMVKKRGKKEIATNIQNAIDAFIDFTSGTKQTNATKKAFFDDVIKLISDEVKTEIETACLNVTPREGTIDYDIASLKDIAKRIYNTETKTANQLYLNSSAVEKLKTSLGNILKDIQSQGTVNDFLLEQMSKSTQEIRNICKVVQQALEDINQMTGRRMFIQDTTIVVPDPKDKKGSLKQYQKNQFMITNALTNKQISIIDFISYLNKEFLNDISWGSAKKKGDVAELIVSTVSAYTKAGAQVTAQQAFETGKQQMWQGRLGGHTAYIQENFIPGATSYLAQQLSKDYELLPRQQGAGIRAIKKSADKVDVLFYYGQQENEKATVSVKNYAEYTARTKGFGGVSGAPMLSLLQSFDQGFVNHWINETIQHTDFTNRFSASEQRPSGMDAAHMLMLYSLVVIGAIGGAQKSNNGGVGNQTQVDYLVWNNNSSKEGLSIKVYPFSMILENCENLISQQNYKKWVPSYEYFFSDEWSMLNFLNTNGHDDPAQEMKSRVLRLLAQLHKIKITTHFFLPEYAPSLTGE